MASDLPSQRVTVSVPQRYAAGHEFVDLRQVEMMGSIEQQRAISSIEQRVQEDGAVVAPGMIRIRWRVEVECLAYPIPEAVLDDLDPEDPDHDAERHRRTEDFSTAVRHFAGAREARPMSLHLDPRPYDEP